MSNNLEPKKRSGLTQAVPSIVACASFGPLFALMSVTSNNEKAAKERHQDLRDLINYVREHDLKAQATEIKALRSKLDKFEESIGIRDNSKKPKL